MLARISAPMLTSLPTLAMRTVPTALMGQRRFAAERPLDPYQVLGIGRDASQAQIKKAYFDLAKRYHPDTAKGDPQTTLKFHQIQSAYETLGDPERRAQFDRGGHCTDNGMADDGQSNHSGFPGSFREGEDPFSGIFGDLFSRFARMNNSSSNSNAAEGGNRVEWDQGDLDVTVGLGLSFDEAVRGTRKTFRYRRSEPCEPCKGNGIQPGTNKSTCGTCKGTGHFRRRMQGLFFSQTCPDCHGSGYQYVACTSCDGKGVVDRMNQVEVEIPAGVERDDVIQRAGLGHSYQGYPRGNLNVHITNVSQSKQFERKQNDIYNTVKVPLHLAILGGTLRVPTVWGDVELTLSTRDGPVQPGSVKRLAGKGVHNDLTGKTGDQYTTLEIVIPTALSQQQQDLLRQFAQTLKEGKP